MRFEVLSLDYDARIKSFMVTARADYEWYLAKTEGSDENLSIQRDIIKGTKPYKNLRNDIRLGCVLPTIVISVSNINEAVTLKYGGALPFIDASPEELEFLEEAVGRVEPEHVNIVDGLQRTNALRQARADLDGDGLASFLSRSLRLEVWINISFFPLAYRMLLLNAGQRPMSMKHQIDVLSGGLANDLSDIDGIEIFRVKERRRRTQPGQYHLSTLAQAFQAWMQGTPNVDKTNLVVETMVVDDALDSLGIDLSNDDGNQRDSFRQCVAWLLTLDRLVGPDAYSFFANDTVVLGYAAAIGFCNKSEILQPRLLVAMQRLVDQAGIIGGSEALGVEYFESLRRGFDTKRFNVGEATRGLVFRAFREYIMQEGTTEMRICWSHAASMSNMA